MIQRPKGQSDRKKRYYSVIKTVEYNTGGKQPKSMQVPHLVNNRVQAGYDARKVRQTIQVAIKNGDLELVDLDRVQVCE